MNKIRIYLLILCTSLTLNSCGGGDDDPEVIVEETANTAPTIPTQVFPLDNDICTDNNVIFLWNASLDAEGNKLTYSIEIAENNTFSPILKKETSFAESKLISLDKGKAYYWRIKAVDSRNAESEFSDTKQFITEGEGISNNIPFAPTLVAPVQDAEIDGTSTVLSWSASDVDNDPLVFDVYLDTNANPSTLVSENHVETSYNASGLNAGTTYYFKIVVKDDNGASSIGQVWSFTTK